MPIYSTCIFCNRTDSKPSREDVLPRWIAREFPDTPWNVKNVITDKTFRTHKHLGIISKRPCRRCNNEWMSRLEYEAQPVLAPLMHGRTATLSVNDQLLIARWLLKTSIMFDLHYEKTRECYFTPSECQNIVQSLSVPRDTVMFLAHFRGSQAEILTREIGWEADPETLPEAYQDMLGFEAYTATFAIKHLALQLFSFRRPKHLPDADLSVEIADVWSDAEIQIWPPVVSGPVTWPPRLFLDDSGFDLFDGRWKDMSLLQRVPSP